jgi:cyclic pyranopterin phosphate synthase
MSEKMQFLPSDRLLRLDELDRICSTFVAHGVRKIRLTGGEPLVRRGFLDLVRSLGRHRRSGALAELTLTTNGMQLDRYAAELVAAGIERINVSLDTLDPDAYRETTRGGRIEKVLSGLDAAQRVGLQVKINVVALRGVNDYAIEDLIRWAHGRGMDLTLIETMPLGETGQDRADQYLPLSTVRRSLERCFTLRPLNDTSGGPARYVRVEETGGRLGFITPLTHNFCELCNRVRLSCDGILYTCLGQDNKVDLRAAIRGSVDDGPLYAAIARGLREKPRGHDFVISRRGQTATIKRHMSATGG